MDTTVALQAITHYWKALQESKEEKELILNAIMMLQKRQNRIHWAYPRSPPLRLFIFEQQLYTDRQFSEHIE